MPQTRSTDWTADRISALREQRGQSQSAFGQDLYATGEATAQVRVSELENARRTPSLAVERTLERMEAGEI